MNQDPQFQITGTISAVSPAVSGKAQNGHDWTKREFLLTYLSGQYSKQLAVAAYGTLANSPLLVPGAAVELTFSIESRPAQNNQRYFTNVTARGLQSLQQGYVNGQVPPQQGYAPQAVPQQAPPAAQPAAQATNPYANYPVAPGSPYATQAAQNAVPFR